MNNEVIATMSMSSVENVFVEIIIENGDTQWKFIRKAAFNRKSSYENDLSVKQIGEAQLTMQIYSNGVWSCLIHMQEVELNIYMNN